MMSTLTANARCVLKILENTGPLTTSQILEYAQSVQYTDICSDCAGGDAFVAAANQLVDRGLVTREFGKGGYRWQLTRK
ncbi:hypothetical protein EU538_00825 [Candidatus Thorarchaeota archaeon]|nr:MAG: hypothetical protein EU538_00825 [Candidatus Thorarchaeota archaeon]